MLSGGWWGGKGGGLNTTFFFYSTTVVVGVGLNCWAFICNEWPIQCICCSRILWWAFDVGDLLSQGYPPRV